MLTRLKAFRRWIASFAGFGIGWFLSGWFTIGEMAVARSLWPDYYHWAMGLTEAPILWTKTALGVFWLYANSS